MDIVYDWMTTLPSAQVYGALFILMASNGFFSTPPSEITWGLAGFLISLGHASPTGLLLAGVAGNVFGTTLLYLVARTWGVKAVTRILRFNPLLGEGLLLSTKQAFDRRGPSIVLVGRCLPLVRSVVSIPAGLANMQIAPFLIMTATGCALWACLWGGAGWALGTEIRQLIEEARLYGFAVTAIVMLLIFLWLGQQMKRYLSLSKSPEVPEQQPSDRPDSRLQ